MGFYFILITWNITTAYAFLCVFAAHEELNMIKH